MKFGRLKENNRNIFLEKHTRIVVEKLVPDTFLEN